MKLLRGSGPLGILKHLVPDLLHFFPCLYDTVWCEKVIVWGKGESFKITTKPPKTTKPPAKQQTPDRLTDPSKTPTTSKNTQSNTLNHFIWLQTAEGSAENSAAAGSESDTAAKPPAKWSGGGCCFLQMPREVSEERDERKLNRLQKSFWRTFLFYLPVQSAALFWPLLNSESSAYQLSRPFAVTIQLQRRTLTYRHMWDIDNIYGK